MSIKLVAVDIDDTLLNSQGKLLPSTKTTIQQATAAGVKVVLCSGRPLAGVQPYLTALKLAGDDQYAITYNGAVIESLAGRVVAKHLVSNQAYRQLTEFGRDHQIPFNVLDENSVIYTADHNVNWITVIQAWENQAGILIREPEELPADFQIAKGLFVGDQAQLDAIEPTVRAKFGSQLSVIRAGKNFLELMEANVNKGQALKDLTTKLGLTPDQVMAMGDEGNDLAMFDFAGTAVCMENGSDIAKEHADYVTASNDADGVAQALQKFVLA